MGVYTLPNALTLMLALSKNVQYPGHNHLLHNHLLLVAVGVERLDCLACHAEDRGSFLPGERKQRHKRLN